MRSVSVLIVNYNGRQHLDGVLGSLRRQTRTPDEVIVVDNASSDGSVEHLRERHGWVRLLALDRNTGFTGGNNAAAAAAIGEILVTLNSDTVVDEAWLEELVVPLEADPALGATVSKIMLGPPGSQMIDCAGAELNNLGYYWGRGANQVDRGQFDSPEHVPGVTACAMALRASALEGEPLFDDELFMYYEELDLTLRLRGRGYAVRYVPSAVVYHLRGQSVKASVALPLIFQQSYANRNRLKLVCKYFPLRLLVRNAPLLLLSALYWDLVFLRAEGPRYAAKALRAQFRYALLGWRERTVVSSLQSTNWVDDLTWHSIAGVLRFRSELGGYEPN